METLRRFGQIVRKRSAENSKAIHLLVENALLGNAMSVLRQELDSMVRVIYLLSCSEDVRMSLIEDTINGIRWKIADSKNGKKSNITDRIMVAYSNQYWGWTKFVYDFGCSFIHLSNFHEYLTEDPFATLSEKDSHTIKEYLNQYHNFPLEDGITAATLEPYLIQVFEKVSENMLSYLEDLENGKGKEAIDFQ